MKTFQLFMPVFFFLFILSACQESKSPVVRYQKDSIDYVKPFHENNRFWQYKGLPVVLRGAVDDGSLSDDPEYKRHIDRLAGAGVNYIYNKMRFKQEEIEDIQPFDKKEGLFLPDQFNQEYWKRFDAFLAYTHEKNIIVQLVLWPVKDFGKKAWKENLWNPSNHSGDYLSESSLSDIDWNKKKIPFFESIPELNNDDTLLDLQQTFVDKMIEYTFNYDHILYCITDEFPSAYDTQWNLYWSEFLKEKADSQDHQIFVTAMYGSKDFYSQQQMNVFNQSDQFEFVEVSANSYNRGHKFWEQLQYAYNFIADKPRPLNMSQIFGNEHFSESGGQGAALNRFWMSVLGGSASACFASPPKGPGLSDQARLQLSVLDTLVKRFDFFRAKPDMTNRLLTDCAEGEMFLTRIENEQYLFFCPGEADFNLDLSKAEGKFRLSWVNLQTGAWSRSSSMKASQEVRIQTPGEGKWIGLLE